MKKNCTELLLLFLPMMAMLACGHLGDRTTVVFGKVYDQNQQPVDSILVMVTGLNINGVVALKSTYTDKNGNYEILLEVPRKFGNINVIIPYGLDNPKLETIYRQAKRTKGPSRPMIGKKTQCDFELEPM